MVLLIMLGVFVGLVSVEFSLCWWKLFGCAGLCACCWVFIERVCGLVWRDNVGLLFSVGIVWGSLEGWFGVWCTFWDAWFTYIVHVCYVLLEFVYFG